MRPQVVDVADGHYRVWGVGSDGELEAADADRQGAMGDSGLGHVEGAAFSPQAPKRGEGVDVIEIGSPLAAKSGRSISIHRRP